jgi:2'-5' RNA ligase
MAALDYPPHVTLAVYDGIPEHQLRETLRSVFLAHRPLSLRFSKLAFFEEPQLVFWAAPDASEALLNVHAAIHRLVEPSLCREYYRPHAWAPHCTLATQVSTANKEKATALAAKKIQPFEVVFDQADCVEFHPVRIIEECVLVKTT